MSPSSDAGSMPNTLAVGGNMDWNNSPRSGSPRAGSVDGGDGFSMASSGNDLDNCVSQRYNSNDALVNRMSRRRMTIKATAAVLSEVNISDVRKVEKLLRRKNIYYDSDDSDIEDKRIKRNRLKQTPLLTRAANKITKRTRQLFVESSLSSDDRVSSRRNKRSYSLSEVDQLRMEIRGFERKLKLYIPQQQDRRSFSPLALSTPRAPVANFKTVRRQSFPSLDNKDWKRSKIYDSLV
jgi:hypothetical protein